MIAAPQAIAPPSESRRADTPTRAPVFLVGAERSGTTLLRLMLNHHPQIVWCSEFEYAVELLDDDSMWPDVGAYCDYLETNRVFHAHGFAIDPALSYPQLVESFLRQKQASAGKPIVGATVHKHFDRLTRLWPDARFIYLLRDARDVARSSINMGWAGNVWCGIDNWINAQTLWTRLRDTLPPDRRIELRYEDLIKNASGELSRLCAFLGVPYDEAMFDYADHSTYDRPDPKLVEQWRRKMTPRQIQLVESRVGDMLAACDYPLSGLPRIGVSPLRQGWMKLHSRFARARFRSQRYGPAVFAADFLSRRLHLARWQRRVKIAINNIDSEHLK